MALHRAQRSDAGRLPPLEVLYETRRDRHMPDGRPGASQRRKAAAPTGQLRRASLVRSQQLLARTGPSTQGRASHAPLRPIYTRPGSGLPPVRYRSSKWSPTRPLTSDRWCRDWRGPCEPDSGDGPLGVAGIARAPRGRHGRPPRGFVRILAGLSAWFESQPLGQLRVDYQHVLVEVGHERPVLTLEGSLTEPAPTIVSA